MMMYKFLVGLLLFSLALQAKIPLLEELNLEQKVGQLLLVHFNGPILNEEARLLMDQAFVGGFIYYNWANELNSPQQVYKLSQSLQSYTSIPLLIAIDQEGGRVVRLKNGFTYFPSNAHLAKIGRPRLVQASAYVTGKELAAVGINLNLAPVVDINSNLQNPVIGDRAYGSTPQLVTTYGARALRGYKEAGIIAALKHFPGHGDTDTDSHYVLPILWHTSERLAQFELFPFAQLAKEAPIIMSAHLLVPAWDEKNCATLSAPIIQGKLRQELGYKGLIMTDSLSMQGLTSICSSIEEAAIMSFSAGHDLLLLGGQQLADQKGVEVQHVLYVHAALVKAFKEERLSQAQLDESVQRILALKQLYGIDQFSPAENLDQVVNCQAHRDLLRYILKQLPPSNSYE
jgi:beta-N-acetylhexosaminidase